MGSNLVPKFKVGDVVLARYNSIYYPNTTFTISSTHANHGGEGNHRYWGDASDGEHLGAYEHQLTLVSRPDKVYVEATLEERRRMLRDPN